MAPAIIDLDVSRVESPILRFQEFRTLADQPGFFGQFVQRTNEPPKPPAQPYIYIHKALFPVFLLFIVLY